MLYTLYLFCHLSGAVVEEDENRISLGVNGMRNTGRNQDFVAQVFCDLEKSPFLIKQKFRILTIFFVGAHQNEVRIGGNSEASATDQGAFQLIA